MTGSIIFLCLHFIFCFLAFALIQRPAFIIANRKISKDKITWRDTLDIYKAGYATDLIAAAYLTALPLIVVWVHLHFPALNIKWPLIATEAIVAAVIALSSLADLALYPHWLFKLDKSVLPYLRSLKGAFASVSTTMLATAIAAFTLLFAALLACLTGLIGISGVASIGSPAGLGGHAAALLTFLLGVGILFLFIRGLHSRPNTPIITYYSTNVFLNHCALNPLYSLIYSMSVNDNPAEIFRFMDADECDSKVKEMYPTAGIPETLLLNTNQPNILLIVWESLCSRFVEPLGGDKGVLPNFNKACGEGVLFTNVDAGSFRTDRGLVCLLSGFLAQPTMSIIRNTRKLPGLPAVPRTLKAHGYHTACMHGGDLKIMHKMDYYVASGHDEALGIEAFDPKAPRCRWGIHDNYMFERLGEKVLSMSANPGMQPWFMTFQTLSSHLPYEVPHHALDNKIHNAYHFTDEAFGKFIERIKATPAWDNLLIIVTGDHGLNDPDLTPLPKIDYVKIPLLMLGGAVKQPMKIDKLMAQTDMAATLLGQLGMQHADFLFSRDVLSESYTRPFTFHTYNNGFLLHDTCGFTDYDNAQGKAAENPDSNRELQGRMIQQTLYRHISEI